MANPYAFPRPFSFTQGGHYAWEQDGMTLRDYFAGQVLAGMAAAGREEFDAVVCYEAADAMLKAREK